MSDILNEPWVSPWKPADKVTPHWDEDDIEMVTVVPADEAGEPRKGRSYNELEAQASQVATLRKLPTADEMHTQRVDLLVTAIKAALDFLSLPKTGATAWAEDLSYHERLTNAKASGLLDKAIDECRTALDFIAVQEDR